MSSCCADDHPLLYSKAVLAADPAQVIATALDNIIMNAGLAWNDTGSSLIIEDPTQGCLDSRASITLLVVLVTATLLLVISYGVALSLLINARLSYAGVVRKDLLDLELGSFYSPYWQLILLNHPSSRRQIR